MTPRSLPEDLSPLLTPTRLAPGLWSIEGPCHELMYLVEGSRRAMLVDTGMGVGDLGGLVRSLSSLPLLVVNTHGHPDHAGGNGGFPQAWLAPEDRQLMRAMTTTEFRLRDLRASQGEGSPEARRLAENLVPLGSYRLRTLRSGQVLDLGNRRFEVLATPGHTPGSVCLLDPEGGLLFTGDSVVSTPVWMYLGHSFPLATYLASLRSLWRRETEFELLLPGHPPAPLGKAQLQALIACAEEILDGRGMGTAVRTFAGEGLQWTHGVATIIYDPARLEIWPGLKGNQP